jgi:hypothetical protein
MCRDTCEATFDWPSDTKLPELVVETTAGTGELKPTISGNYLCDFEYVSQQIVKREEHKAICTFGKFEFFREEAVGIVSTFIYKCQVCEKIFRLSTQPPDKIESTNDAVVWGALSIGIGREQLEEQFGILDSRMMSARKFRRHEVKIEKVITLFYNAHRFAVYYIIQTMNGCFIDMYHFQ